MIVEPERYIQEFIDCGADLITFHLEATEKAAEIIDEIHRQGKKPVSPLNRARMWKRLDLISEQWI